MHPPVFIRTVTLLLITLVASCSTQATMPSDHGSVTQPPPDLAFHLAEPADLAPMATDDLAAPYQLPQGAPVDAGTPPAWACGTDAAAPETGAICDLPPSQCADDRWLVYYVNGRCVHGACQWEKRYLDCRDMGRACQNGGCVFNGTM